MTSALSAELIAKSAESALPQAWSKWSDGWKRAFEKERDRGYKWHTGFYGDGVPPALLFASRKTKKANTETDRLIVCVNNGSDTIAFEPWAWKALYLFVHDLTSDKQGDLLAGFQALCRISLIPNATLSTNTSTGSGRSELLSYRTRNGEVEMNRRTNEDGTTTVQVVATGIPTAKDAATTRELKIPESVPPPGISRSPNRR